MIMKEEERGEDVKAKKNTDKCGGGSEIRRMNRENRKMAEGKKTRKSRREEGRGRRRSKCGW